jgi:hypothetical protein
MALSYKKSKSGRYKVELVRAFPRRGFIYKPGQDNTVSQAILDEMIAEGVVESVVASG